MKRTETVLSSLSDFFIQHAIVIFLLATGGCLFLVAYMADYLKPNVIEAWVLVGILTTLLFSGVALVVLLGVAAFQKARSLKIITFEPRPPSPFTSQFEQERIKIANFYSPFLVPNENKSFKDCEIYGPGSILFLDSNAVSDCSFHMCDYVVIKEGAKINTAAYFAKSSFIGCKFFNITFYIPETLAERIFDKHKESTGEALTIVGIHTQ
jgi:hypothetical protein